MVNILQVYVPFKLNFIQHILFMTITIKAIKKNFLSMLLFLSNTTGSSTGQPRQRCGVFQQKRNFLRRSRVNYAESRMRAWMRRSCWCLPSPRDRQRASPAGYSRTHGPDTQQFAPTINWLEDTLCIVVYPLNIPKCSAGSFQLFRSIPSIQIV